MTLGQRIRRARLAAGLTQLDLARRVGQWDARLERTSEKRVSEWENDATPRLAFYVVDAIARATETPLDVFSSWGAEALDAAVAAGRARAEALGGDRRRGARREAPGDT